MRMKLATILKAIAVCAAALAYGRWTGYVGLFLVSVLVTCYVVPAALVEFGRRLGDPILAGLLGGRLACAVWVVGSSAVSTRRMAPQSVFALVPIGMVLGLLYGLFIDLGDCVRGRARPRDRRRAFRYDLTLLLFLIAAIASVVIVDTLRWEILPGVGGFSPASAASAPSGPTLSP